tara:strand:+ start:5875 stop:6870 length:996 start_codon:yes stop_codon:yes gene_type:complete
MKLNFKDILTEQDSPKRNERFIDAMVVEMKKFFENRYSGTHWTRAASFSNASSPEKFREHLSNVKSIGKQVDQLQKKLNKIDRLSPKAARDLSSSFNELQGSYLRALHHLTHLGELFSGVYGKSSFVVKYAIPIGVLIEVYEKFVEEVYKPGVIEYNKTEGDVQLEYGLPNSDYSGLKYYDSSNGDGRYLIMKDNVNNDYLLGINHGWHRDWRSDGFNPEKLYYKRYSSLTDIKKDLLNIESKNIKTDIKGAGIDMSEEHFNKTFEFINNLDINEIQREADEEQTTLEYMLGDEIDGFVNWKNDFNVSSSESQTIAKYYLEYKEVVDRFNF